MRAIKRACGKLRRCEEERCSLRVLRKPSPRSTLSDPRNVPLSVMIVEMSAYGKDKMNIDLFELGFYSHPLASCLSSMVHHHVVHVFDGLLYCCYFKPKNGNSVKAFSTSFFFTSFHNRPQ